MTIIGLKELRQNASQIAERAQKGERFTVVKRSKIVFEISPPSTNNAHELKDWTKQAIERYRPALKALNKK
ncbi:hypothetical protein KY385_03915 [Candidatus Parcubacteria bacterium]|nr:hypothetical protein [Candidatus Parcubacteria bacterium]